MENFIAIAGWMSLYIIQLFFTLSEHNYVTKLEWYGSSGLYFLYLEYQI